jgi:hypothetical protein
MLAPAFFAGSGGLFVATTVGVSAFLAGNLATIFALAAGFIAARCAFHFHGFAIATFVGTAFFCTFAGSFPVSFVLFFATTIAFLAFIAAGFARLFQRFHFRLCSILVLRYVYQVIVPCSFLGYKVSLKRFENCFVICGCIFFGNQA